MHSMTSRIQFMPIAVAPPINIEALPQGYETVLGRRWGKGEELGRTVAEGRWRAPLMGARRRRAGPRRTDLGPRRRVRGLPPLRRADGGRIAGAHLLHRFSTVHMADRIVVLSEGRIHELETHAKLIELNAPTRVFLTYRPREAANGQLTSAFRSTRVLQGRGLSATKHQESPAPRSNLAPWKGPRARNP